MLLLWLFEGTVVGQISIEHVRDKRRRFGPRFFGPNDKIRCNKESALVKNKYERKRKVRKEGKMKS